VHHYTLATPLGPVRFTGAVERATDPELAGRDLETVVKALSACAQARADHPVATLPDAHGVDGHASQSRGHTTAIFP
jgi:hypothetical protein